MSHIFLRNLEIFKNKTNLNSKSYKKKFHHHHSSHEKLKFRKSNPCTDYLSEIEYLEHMIPHHQVAVDMSYLLISKTKNPDMLHLCRNIIRKQKYEIWEMRMILKRLSGSVFSSKRGRHSKEHTKLEKYYPKKSQDNEGICNPLFFKPNDHMQHMKHTKVTDKNYLEHMIPHHQVAIDMSKRLLLYTNHSYTYNFCKQLIIDQQSEIFYMNNLLNNSYNYKSVIL
jgi:uncharacterized protein (DUF305 family)